MISMPDPRPTNEDRIRAALWFAERGFGVFSVWSTDDDGTCRCARHAACDQPGKHPIGNQGFHDSTRDPDRIRTMLGWPSEPNYGLVCPDGVFALDVDGDGIAQFAAIEERLGALPPTLTTRTANGRHVFLRWPDDLPRPLGRMFGFVTRWGSGASAGYVIGPRSVHRSGFVYAPDGQCMDITTLPDAWAAALVQPTPDTGDDAVLEFDSGYELVPPGFAGSRYDAIRDYIASRYMRGISKDEILAGVLTVLAPRFAQPLPEPDIRSRFERAWKGTSERLGPPMKDPRHPAHGTVLSDAAAAAATAAPAEPTISSDWPAPPDPIVYHGTVGEIVGQIASATEADPVGVLGSLLASIGVCMGHGRYIYQGSAQSPNLFLVLVGDSASGRKGTAGSIAREVMDAAYPEWSQLIVPGLGSGEGLIGYLKAREKLGDERALVMESEFGRLLTVMAREGSTLSPMVRDAWDGVPMGRILAREQAVVHSHHVGILAHVTPVELRQKLTGSDAANGFGNRFIWLGVRRSRLVPFPESPVKRVDRALLDDLGAAIEEAQMPGSLNWSPEARDEWESLYLELALQGRYGLFASMTARTEAQIVRLALVYALIDRASAIGVVHLQAARALWAYAERSVAYVFGSSTGDRHADALRDLIADGPVKWEDAKKELGLRTAADLASAVSLLESIGLAETARVRMTNVKQRVRIIRKRGTTTTTTTTTQGPAHEKGGKTA